MNENPTGRGGWAGRWLAIGGTGLLLGVWPVMAHLEWGRGEGLVHGIPAFFLGGFAWLVGLGLVWLVGGLRRDGLRWLISREAWGRFLAVLAMGFSMGVLFHGVEAWRGRRAWVRVEAEARARGMSLDVRSLVPPVVAEAEDFGRAPMFEPLRRSLESRSGRGFGEPDPGPLGGLLKWAQSRAPWGSAGRRIPGWMVGQSQSADLGRGGRRSVPSAVDPASLAQEFLAGVEVHGPLLEEARRHAGRSHCRMPFDYEAPFLADTTSDRVLLALQRLAFARAHALVVLGRGEEALGDLDLGWRLVLHGRTLPGLYYSGSRAWTVAYGMQAVWEGLARRTWDEAGLVRLQRSLESLAGGDGEIPGRRQVGAVALATVAFLEGLIPTDRGLASVETWAGIPEEDRRVIEWARRVYPTGWSLQDQASVVEGWLILDSKAGFDGGTDVVLERSLRDTSDPVYRLFVLPKVRQMLTDAGVFPRFEVDVLRLAARACAVERFRMGKGRLPESADDAVALGLSDPGREAGRLRYRKETDGRYVVYSVGLDGRDDGGVMPSDPGPGGDGDVPIGLRDWTWVSGVLTVEPSVGGKVR